MAKKSNGALASNVKLSKKASVFAEDMQSGVAGVAFKATEGEKRPAAFKTLAEAEAAYIAAATALETGAAGLYGFYPKCGRMLNELAVKAKFEGKWFDMRANSKTATIPAAIAEFRETMKPHFSRFCPSNPDRPWEYIRTYARRDAELGSLFGMKPKAEAAAPAAAKTEAAAPAAAKAEAAAPAAAEEEVTQETLKKKTLEDIERALKRLQKAQAAWKTEDVRKAEKGLTSAFNALTGGGIG